MENICGQHVFSKLFVVSKYQKLCWHINSRLLHYSIRPISVVKHFLLSTSSSRVRKVRICGGASFCLMLSITLTSNLAQSCYSPVTAHVCKHKRKRVTIRERLKSALYLRLRKRKRLFLKKP